VKNEYWHSGKPKVYAWPMNKKTPAAAYTNPVVTKVPVEASFDDGDFLPSYSSDGSHADLRANLPLGPLDIGTGGCEVLDCGFSMKIPAGYRCVVSGCVQGLFLTLEDSERVRVKAFNTSEPLTLHHRSIVGKISIEPIYLFNWITKG
jgi:hypothetical protein